MREDLQGVIADFWRQRSAEGGESAARFHIEHTAFDQALLTRFCGPGSRMLDLGCGTLSLANWLVEAMGATVHAVDAQAAFLAHALQEPRPTTEQADVRFYRPAGQFDVILLFGVIQYIVSDAERAALYARLSGHLAPAGALIVKSQFGMTGAVEVDTFSQALGCHYCSLYPALAAEIELLSRWFSVEVLSLYPDELSPHQNTKFRHLICRATS